MSLNVIAPIALFNAVSLAASRVSAPIHVQYSDNIMIQFVWTGTPTGTFGVDVSNTATLLPNGSIIGGTWSALDLTSPDSPAAAGSANDGVIIINQIPASFLRLTYTSISGTGICTATLTAKPV